MTDPSKSANAPTQIDDFSQAQNYAADYLRTYYSGEPTPDDQALMRFLVLQFPRLTEYGRPELAEVGCGPVISHMLPAAPYVSQIQMYDFRDDNLEEIRKWRDDRSGAHNWHQCTRFVLEAEDQAASDGAIRDREQSLRTLIGKIGLCDLRRAAPLAGPQEFSAVACFYTTEQASCSRDEWRNVFRNLCRLVAPGGMLFACSVADTDYYVVYRSDGRPVRYSIPRLLPADYEQALAENGFVSGESTVQYQSLTGQEDEGVVGVILVAAKKAADQMGGP